MRYQFTKFLSRGDTNHVDTGLPLDMIYLDFRKAFDVVPHCRLMLKIRTMGILCKISDWIEAWLRDRCQRVVINGECSDWCKVSSGVPQGSILGPLLFIIYINDIDSSVLSRLWKFADDTKTLGVVDNIDKVNSMREDVRKLYEWSIDWQIMFNLEKCKVMHIGVKNQNHDYTLGGLRLSSTKEEKDLGVIVSDDIKSLSQCAAAVKKANRIVGMIRRNFKFKDKDVMIKLYKSLIRPHLEFCAQVWNPWLLKDIKLLEGVQRRFTKFICKDNVNKTYTERLQLCHLTSLETRRIRGGLIETFKIIRGFVDVDASEFFMRSDRQGRGHCLKLVKPRAKLEVRRNYFNVSIIDVWNDLPEEAVVASNINSFKGLVDRYLLDKGYV